MADYDDGLGPYVDYIGEHKVNYYDGTAATLTVLNSYEATVELHDDSTPLGLAIGSKFMLATSEIAELLGIPTNER